MERLAWVEILDRHGDVVIRHPVQAWPLRVGRAYDSDIVLDDPYVAPHHIEIVQSDSGKYQLRDQNSINGVMINNALSKNADMIVTPADVLRLGHTQFRILPSDFAVAVEKKLTNVVWLRSWPGLIFGFVILLLAHLLNLWLEYNRDDGYKLLVAPLLGDIPLVLLWAGLWALIGRVLSGNANFIAHAVLVSLTVAVTFLLGNTLTMYIDFMYNSKLANGVIFSAIVYMAIGWLFYRHVGLVSRASRRKIGIAVAVIVGGLFGIFYAIDKWNSADDLSRMSYSPSIGPPSMLLVHGISVEKFMENAGKLKSRIDLDENE